MGGRFVPGHGGDVVARLEDWGERQDPCSVCLA